MTVKTDDITKGRKDLDPHGRFRGECVNREDLGKRLSCFGCEKKNGGTVGGTFSSFHNELLSENIVRRQLNGQRLLLGVYLQT